jgi:hypothetical protein
MAKNPVKIQYTSTVHQQRHYTMSEEWQKNPVKIQYTSTVNKQRHYTMSEEWQKNPVKIQIKQLKYVLK